MLRTAKTEFVVKRVNDTRWCARADATVALSKGYSGFQKASQVLLKISQKLQISFEAKCLLKYLSRIKKSCQAFGPLS
ncbi:hypothetical protein TNCT_471401 [Trichonephila clavata]|uniref:Uncharacterized protein n=1 Tax=Trichonephila clavata TaxID=2740835 RepID=A0A8X6LUY1_TRICU|nr:hypothetical protein TNCT_471401 [Trichonephila clavata]